MRPPAQQLADLDLRDSAVFDSPPSANADQALLSPGANPDGVDPSHLAPRASTPYNYSTDSDPDSDGSGQIRDRDQGQDQGDWKGIGGFLRRKSTQRRKGSRREKVKMVGHHLQQAFRSWFREVSMAVSLSRSCLRRRFRRPTWHAEARNRCPDRSSVMSSRLYHSYNGVGDFTTHFGEREGPDPTVCVVTSAFHSHCMHMLLYWTRRADTNMGLLPWLLARPDGRQWPSDTPRASVKEIHRAALCLGPRIFRGGQTCCGARDGHGACIEDHRQETTQRQ